jgi:hypothetical protein
MQELKQVAWENSKGESNGLENVWTDMYTQLFIALNLFPYLLKLLSTEIYLAFPKYYVFYLFSLSVGVGDIFAKGVCQYLLLHY